LLATKATAHTARQSAEPADCHQEKYDVLEEVHISVSYGLLWLNLGGVAMAGGRAFEVKKIWRYLVSVDTRKSFQVKEAVLF
jgi:hypothetical protein